MALTLIALLTSLNAAQADDIAHLQVDRWIRHKPTIALCNGIGIPDSVINEAVERWRKRGAKIGPVVRKTCEARPQHGEIGFYLDDEVVGSNEGYAVRTVFTGTQEIAYARVWIKSSNHGSMILIEHELGHGLGYTDTNAGGSIMSKEGAIY